MKKKRPRPKSTPWWKDKQIKDLLAQIETAKKVWLLVLLPLAALLLSVGASVYLHFFQKPDISVWPVGVGQKEPIGIGWGQQVLIINLKNDSPTAIHLERFEVGFTPINGFSLLEETTYFARLVQSWEQNTPFKLEYFNMPTLNPFEDLHTAVTYQTPKSTQPFTLVISAEAKIADSHFAQRPWNWFSKIRFPIHRPTVRTTRVTTYVPTGRTEGILAASSPQTHGFRNFGPIKKIDVQLYTSDPDNTPVYNCYGFDENRRPIITHPRAQFVPGQPGKMCK